MKGILVVFILAVLIGLSIGSASVYIIASNTIIKQDSIQFPVERDTIMIVDSNLIKRYVIKLDSVEAVKDSIIMDLVVAKYKLNRIKEYNKIAAKGSNLKYLRGWINRVVNE